jgi:hypothetical protein
MSEREPVNYLLCCLMVLPLAAATAWVCFLIWGGIKLIGIASEAVSKL